MAIYEINAAVRDMKGKGGARKTRREGRVPAVAYGYELTPTTLSVGEKELADFLRRHNASTALVQIKVDGPADLGGKVFRIKDLQMDYIEQTALSVDFQAIDMTKPVTVDVPLIYEGTAAGEKFGGVVTPLARELTVRCLPKDIPATIHVDINPLGEGETWFVSHLTLPEGVTSEDPADTPLVACNIPKAAPTPEEEAAAAEGEAAEGEAAAGGEAKAEGDKAEKADKGDKGKESASKKD
ncbi:MAG: 50S ribosomal protein L25 [Deltaproteobacteria bacterium]|nr:50S ribosomal protein L25 [Deltaproteobacteria bacterium]